MDMKQIKELLAAMEKAGLTRIRIKEEKGYEIELEKKVEVMPVYPPQEVQFAPPKQEAASHFTPASRLPSEEKREHTEGSFIQSPMVGTFYEAHSPDDAPYVKVGDIVTEDTVVAIIEAMKVMNEVKAGKKGKIAEILVSNAEPVEFATKLFRIV